MQIISRNVKLRMYPHNLCSYISDTFSRINCSQRQMQLIYGGEILQFAFT